MKKGIIIVVLLLATLVFTGGCVSNETPTSAPSQSGDVIAEEKNLLLTKTFYLASEVGEITVTTNELTRTATATIDYNSRNNFESQSDFELSSSPIISILVNPSGFFELMNIPLDPEVQSFLENIDNYNIQSVIVSGYINGQYVSATVQL